MDGLRYGVISEMGKRVTIVVADRNLRDCQAARQRRGGLGRNQGRCTTSEMPAAINAWVLISSADAVASRIGRSGTNSCSATANQRF